jgi:hypothetical protein
MQPNSALDPTAGSVPEAVPAPVRAAPPVARTPSSSPLGRLLGVLRGDKYMADAYPPAGPDRGER